MLICGPNLAAVSELGGEEVLDYGMLFSWWLVAYHFFSLTASPCSHKESDLGREKESARYEGKKALVLVCR